MEFDATREKWSVRRDTVTQQDARGYVLWEKDDQRKMPSIEEIKELLRIMVDLSFSDKYKIIHHPNTSLKFAVL